MIAEKRKVLLDKMAQDAENSFDKVMEMDIEEVLYLVRAMQSANGNVEGAVIDGLIEKVKAFEGWYLLRFRAVPVPFILSGKAYIFTHPDIGQKALEKYEAAGYHLELYKYPLYDEDLFGMLSRHRVQMVSVNKSGGGMALAMDALRNGEQQEGGELTAAVAAFVAACDVQDERAVSKAEENFATVMRAATLFYASVEHDDMPILEKTYSGGYEHDSFFVFSDRVELKKQYPRFTTVVREMETGKLFSLLPGAEFILNPMTSNIIIGKSAVDTAVEYAAYYERVFQEARKCRDSNAAAAQVAKVIMQYDDIRNEFLAGLDDDGFGRPIENPISVDGYTAQVFQKTMVKSSVDAYAMLAHKRTESVAETR